MREHKLAAGGGKAIRLLAVVLLLAAIPAVQAEAPFYYDPLGSQADYDPDLFPLNRSAGGLELMFQAWSDPHDNDSKQSVFNQEFIEQFRLRWFASLDSDFTLLVEGKASGKGHVVSDDYFLKLDLGYQGLEQPVIPYGGMSFAEETWVGYFGLETLSHRTADVVPSMENQVPIAYRGWAEVRLPESGDPTLRLQGLVHSLPELAQGMVVSVGLDTFFTPKLPPDWLLTGHWDWEVTQGFGRVFTTVGYAYNLRTDEQRASVGGGLRVF